MRARGTARWTASTISAACTASARWSARRTSRRFTGRWEAAVVAIMRADARRGPLQHRRVPPRDRAHGPRPLPRLELLRALAGRHRPRPGREGRRRRRGDGGAHSAFFRERPDAPARGAGRAGRCRGPARAGPRRRPPFATPAAPPRFAIGRGRDDAHHAPGRAHPAAALRARQARRRSTPTAAVTSSPTPTRTASASSRSTSTACGSRRRELWGEAAEPNQHALSRSLGELPAARLTADAETAWARTIRTSTTTSSRACERSSRCCSRRACWLPTPSTASSAATRPARARCSARAPWRGPGGIPPTSVGCSQDSTAALGDLGVTYDRLVVVENTPARPQRRRLHALLLLPVGRHGPAADLVQDAGLPLARGERAAHGARGVRPRPSRPSARCACGTAPPSCATWCCRWRRPAPSGWTRTPSRRQVTREALIGVAEVRLPRRRSAERDCTSERRQSGGPPRRPHGQRGALRGQLFVCATGCCCGRTDDGFAAVPTELYHARVGAAATAQRRAPHHRRLPRPLRPGQRRRCSSSTARRSGFTRSTPRRWCGRSTTTSTRCWTADGCLPAPPALAPLQFTASTWQSRPDGQPVDDLRPRRVQ